MNGWMDGWMDEWMDGRMDGQMREQEWPKYKMCSKKILSFRFVVLYTKSIFVSSFLQSSFYDF
jgi:hypothetical protein